MFRGMDKKTLAVIIGGAVLIVLIVLVILMSMDRSPGNRPSTNDPNDPSALLEENGSKTRLEVPEDIVVPDQNSSVSGDVAKPDAVAQLAPGVSAKIRTFNISIDNDKFSPSTIIANVNDVVHINFTAVDKDYEITQPDYGYQRLIGKGETKPIEGQFTAEGKYVLYCSSCGGPDKGPVGYLIAVP